MSLSIKFPSPVMRLTYEIDRLNPIVLVIRHAQFVQHVALFANLQDLHHRGVQVVNLFDEVHEANEKEEPPVDFAHDAFFIVGCECRQESCSVVVACIILDRFARDLLWRMT